MWYRVVIVNREFEVYQTCMTVFKDLPAACQWSRAFLGAGLGELYPVIVPEHFRCRPGVSLVNVLMASGLTRQEIKRRLTRQINSMIEKLRTRHPVEVQDMVVTTKPQPTASPKPEKKPFVVVGSAVLEHSWCVYSGNELISYCTNAKHAELVARALNAFVANAQEGLTEGMCGKEAILSM